MYKYFDEFFIHTNLQNNAPTNLNDPEFVTASWELVDQVLSDTIQHVKNSPQTTAI